MSNLTYHIYPPTEDWAGIGYLHFMICPIEPGQIPRSGVGHTMDEAWADLQHVGCGCKDTICRHWRLTDEQRNTLRNGTWADTTEGLCDLVVATVNRLNDWPDNPAASFCESDPV